MADRDVDFIPEEDENPVTPQDTKNWKKHVHYTIVRNEATGTNKLKCT